MKFSKIATGLLLLSMATRVYAEANDAFCGNPMKVVYGPFDYRKRAEFVDQFNLVEGAHFTADVENGIKGSSSFIGGDLSYTLIVIPNHQRALASLSKLAIRRNHVARSGQQVIRQNIDYRHTRHWFSCDHCTGHTGCLCPIKAGIDFTYKRRCG